jgi:hypothetical protein
VATNDQQAVARAQIEALIREHGAELLKRMEGVKHVDPMGDIRSWWDRVKTAEYLRMLQWLILSVGLIAVSKLWAFDPEIKTALFKYGVVTGGGWLGYWIYRTMARIRPHTVESEAARATRC